MDTTDPEIEFDNNGVCNHCRDYEERAREEVHFNKYGKKELNRVVLKIKKDGKNKKYDCIIGVSGGADSTYVAYLTKKLGLRPLAVHLDNGWDSELSVKNIELALKKLDIDLYTYVVDWEEFKDLQLSFLKSSISSVEIPTDHAINAILFQMACKEKISYILGGSNVVTEAIMPERWSYSAFDFRLIKSIQKKFGTCKLKAFPHYNFLQIFYYIFIKKTKYITILNYIEYNKKEAISILENELGWKNYGEKHYESIYTRLCQGYILPEKFGFDKRRAHLSTLINSGQITREEALVKMKQNPYQSEEMLKEDKVYVLKKLNISEEELQEIMDAPEKLVEDYPSNAALFKKLAFFIRWAKRIATYRKYV